MALVACPKCRAKVQIKSTTASSVRCPKCNKLISLETDDEGDDYEDEGPRKKFRPRDDEENEGRPISRNKRRSRDDDDDFDDDRPRKKPSNLGKQNNNGVLIGAIVGSALMVLVLGTVGFLVFRSKPDSDSSSSSGSSTSPDTNNLSNDFSDDFSGHWPEPIGLKDVMAQGDAAILHINGVVDKGTAETIGYRLDEIVPTGGGSRSSTFTPPRLTIALRPIKNAEEFAKKIDFGRVKSVNGNVIYIAGHKLEGPPSDPVERALQNLKSKSEQRRGSAIDTLMSGFPENKRAEIFRLLEPLIDDPITGNKAIEAYCKWANKDNVPTLLKILSSEQTRGNSKFAIQAFVRLKDERGIDQIARCLDNFPLQGEAKKALISFGPAAEDAVLNRLKDANGGVRGVVLEILGKIGTKKSLLVLEQLAKGNDLRLRMLANNAIDEIKKRM